MVVDEHLISRGINTFEHHWFSRFQKYVIIKRFTAGHLMDAVNDILDIYDSSYRVQGAPFNEGANICQLLVKKNVL